MLELLYVTISVYISHFLTFPKMDCACASSQQSIFSVTLDILIIRLDLQAIYKWVSGIRQKGCFQTKNNYECVDDEDMGY